MKNVSFTFIHRSDRKKTLCLAVYQGRKQHRIILPIKTPTSKEISWNLSWKKRVEIMPFQ
jgi:hypothetical protein